jgi:solute carrier family 25 (mitochondrial iron transporter), member 28/37
MNPFDTIKQRMQLGYYKNIKHCLNSIIRTEGPAALYRSLPTTLVMNIPFGCIMVSVNESCKKFLKPSGEYSISTSMISGAIAGTFAAAITNPLDVIKTRLQTQNLEPCPKSQRINTKPLQSMTQFDSLKAMNSITGSNRPLQETIKLNSAFDAVKDIIRFDGYLGFTRGVVARVFVHAPSVAISWTAYESVKRILINKSF